MTSWPLTLSQEEKERADVVEKVDPELVVEPVNPATVSCVTQVVSTSMSGTRLIVMTLSAHGTSDVFAIDAVAQLADTTSSTAPLIV